MIDRKTGNPHGHNDFVAEHFRRSCDTLERAAEDAALRDAIHAIAAAITESFRSGHKLLVAGDGGSAADAQHIAGEFLSRLNFDRDPLPAMALTTDTSVLTAVGNDYGFDRVFERQVRGLGQPGDAFIAISTSGRSPNVIAALKAARNAAWSRSASPAPQPGAPCSRSAITALPRRRRKRRSSSRSTLWPPTRFAALSSATCSAARLRLISFSIYYKYLLMFTR